MAKSYIGKDPNVAPDLSLYLKNDGTTPLTTNWDVGAYTITALRFVSDQTTGTAPLTVSSTTMVSNLNANYLGGQTYANLQAEFQPIGALVGINSAETTTTRTAVIGDKGKATPCSNAAGCTVTMNQNVFAAGDVCHYYGTQGQVTIADGTATALNGTGTLTNVSLEAYETITVIWITASTYICTGTRAAA
jgi:hypothetical protein